LKTPAAVAAAPSLSVASLVEALGGRANIRGVRLAASRLCIAVKNADAVADARIAALTVRGIARPEPNSLHIVLGPSAAALYQELNAIL
jgi:phosphotransferase system IIB component